MSMKLSQNQIQQLQEAAKRDASRSMPSSQTRLDASTSEDPAEKTNERNDNLEPNFNLTTQQDVDISPVAEGTQERRQQPGNMLAMGSADDTQVRWSPASRQDLIDIWQYFARLASPNIADNLLCDIVATVARLAEYPLTRTLNDLIPGVRAVRSHPYILFYRIAKNVPEIVRVLHEHLGYAHVLSEKPNS
jgi:plasmid stabilization system protein ParE